MRQDEPFEVHTEALKITARFERPPQEAHTDPDLPLVEDIKNGNTSAFDELVKRHDRRLFRIAMNVLHNREDAQDAVQEALFKAFTKVEQFRGRSKFSSWLIRIVLNEALMKSRVVRRTFISIDDTSREAEERIHPREIVDWAPNPEMAYSRSELRAILELSLRKLSKRQRAAFILRDIEGLPIEEVAEALDLSESAVKTRTMRARLRLREELSHYFKRRGCLSEDLPDAFTLLVPVEACFARLANS
jgi:RNA polymerase sigma-70 factor, ECF subfamily